MIIAVNSIRPRLLVGGILAALSVFAEAAPLLVVDQSLVANLLPGETFALAFQVDNPDSLSVVSYDFFVRASHNEIFAVTAQVLDYPLDEPVVERSLPYEVRTTAGDNFGAVSFGIGFSTGISNAQTLTFKVAASVPPGVYQLNFGWDLPLGGGPNLVNYELNEFPMAEPIKVVVQVVPEPAPAALMAFGFAAVAGTLTRFGRRLGSPITKFLRS